MNKPTTKRRSLMKLKAISYFALFLIGGGVLGISGCSVSVQPIEPGYRGYSYIKVIAATYGKNCGNLYGNVTHHLAQSCDGREFCEYVLDHRVIGDPAPGCPKDFFAEWQCGRHPEIGTIGINPEASGARIVLRCPVR